MKIGLPLRYSPVARIARWFSRALPKGLYARALIIIIAPVILLQSVVAYAFSPLVSAGERRLGWPRIGVVALGYAIAAVVVAIVGTLLAGRIAAEMIAPAPPGVPRLVPGQRITADHVAFLVANHRAGAFVLDPVDPTGETVRVVAS